jgi:hypothetical protein
MKHSLILVLAMVALIPGLAAGKVQDSTANGFTIKQSYNMAAAPDEVYRRFLRIGEWWSSDHTYSHDAHNLSIEEKPMGCFCEKLPGGGVRHLELVFVMPGKLLRFTGGLGPMLGMAVAATLSVQFTAAEGGTRVDMTYTAGGYSPEGLNSLAGIIDTVLAEQFGRLKNYVEHGNPVAAK